MFGDRRATNDPTFDKLVKRGILLPEVRTPEDYYLRFRNAYDETLSQLSRIGISQLLTVETYLSSFGRLFGNLYHSANPPRFRALNEQVIAGSPQPADPLRIPNELTLCFRQTNELLGPKTIDAFFVAAVFMHVRIKCIQPVIDGNKRSSRTLADGLLLRVMKRTPQSWGTPPGYADYYDALKAAKSRRLDPMINILRRGYGLPLVTEPVISPYRMRSFLIGDGAITDRIEGRTALTDETPLEKLYELSMNPKHQERVR